MPPAYQLQSNQMMLAHAFLLTSGRHCNIYVEKFRVLENPLALDEVCRQMSEIVQEKKIN